MNKDIKLGLLLVPLIFMVSLFVPAMIVDIASEEILEVIWITYWLILCISMLIWCALFYYIPIGAYIAILVAYTVVSWTWILRQKKGNAVYFIMWFVLCALSILMYLKWGDIYYSMLWI